MCNDCPPAEWETDLQKIREKIRDEQADARVRAEAREEAMMVTDLVRSDIITPAVGLLLIKKIFPDVPEIQAVPNRLY